MYFGISKDIITPPFNMVLACARGNMGNYEYVHDDVFVRCLAMSDGKNKTVLMSMDLLFHERSLNDELAKYAKEKYDIEPSFDLARRISTRSYEKAEAHNAKDKNFADAILYLERAFKFPEFKSQTAFAQARLYLNMARYQDEAKRRSSTIAYIKKAKSACPDYPEPYFMEADWVEKAKLGSNKFVNGVKYCAVYDLYAKALAKVKALETSADTEIRTNLKANDIEDLMFWCEQYFPDAAEVFMQGWKEGEKYPLKSQAQLGGTYNTVIRVAK